MANFKEIIKKEDLSVNYFKEQAVAIKTELNRNGNTRYILEKIRNVEELKKLYCRDKIGWADKDRPKVKRCIRKLTPNI